MILSIQKFRLTPNALLAVGMAVVLGVSPPSVLPAQTETAALQDDSQSAESDAPAPLTEDELEILVARIALYPDDLVALVTSASIYPLQIIEAQRYLDQVAKDKSLKPKESWDGSVISLLNYPDIVKMMSDDLEWTQSLGDALAAQQSDVLVAIQQLREQALASGIIKTDDKMSVVQEDDNIIIQPTKSEAVYVPQYAPEMLYAADYPPEPVRYYPDPYPNYYYPSAPYFAAFVTGSVWAAAVDWNDWGVWGGRWNNDVNINCKKCFNNIDGKIKLNDVDWRKVDRNKIDFDHHDFDRKDRKAFRNDLKSNRNNSFDKRVNNARNSGNTHIGNQNRSHNKISANDVRNAKNSGNKVKINNNVNIDNSKNDNRKVSNKNSNKKIDNSKNVKSSNSKINSTKANANINKVQKKANVRKNVERPVRKPRPGERVDNRNRKPSALGEVRGGRTAQRQSVRGHTSMSRSHSASRSHNRGGRRR